MPWTRQGRCVYKKNADGSRGSLVKCHPDTEKAKKHLRALYREVPDAKKGSKMEITEDQMAVQLAALRTSDNTSTITSDNTSTITSDNTSTITPTSITINTPSVTFTPNVEPSTFSPIRLYFREGEQTPDRRVIDPNAVNFNRPPPYAIRLQTTQPESGGHAGAVVCGVITKITRDGLTIVSDGFLDLTTEAGREAFNLISNRTMQTWSPDLGDATVDYETNASDEDANEATHLDEVAHYVQATFLGATLVSMPALASAVVELLDAAGNVTVPAPDREGLLSQPTTEEPTTGLLRYITARSDETGIARYLTSCAASSAPPSSFFTDPELPELQRYVTVTPEGRVFTHVAGYGECHIGFRNTCVTIADIADCRGDGDFEYARPGYVICADGTKVATGPIAMKGGHAPRGLSWQETLAHYDDPSAAIADVVYGMDEFGCWLSGAIRPTATEDQIRTLLASGVSLDAREIEGKLRYLATCSVNTPGFSKASARLYTDGDQTRVIALVAVGGAPQPNDCDCHTE